MSAITVLTTRRDNLEAELRATLVAGKPTEKVRGQIADVLVRIQAIERAEREVREIAIAVDAAKIKADAVKHAAAIETAHQAIILSLDPQDEIPVSSSPVILAAAAELARATADSDKATAQLQAAQAFAQQIRERTEALTDFRASIVARRQAGNHKPTDAGELELIAADQEGMTGIVAEAGTKLADAGKIAAELTTARSHALKHLAQAEAGALLEALQERAQTLDAMLLDCLNRLTGAERSVGTRPVYIGTHELRLNLQMRAAQRPDISTAGMPGSRFRRVG